MGPPAESTRFAEVALPHLDAAYNLARWITRDSSDASDVVALNAALVLTLTGARAGLVDAFELARTILRSGAAWQTFERAREAGAGG